MKAMLLILVGTIGMMVGSSVFAACGGGCVSRCGQESYCDSAMGQCQCTDPGYNKYHTCMTECEYCRMFGNVGEH